MSELNGSDGWVRRFHPAPHAAARLICFPHAGGASTYFFPVSRTLSPGIEVLAIQYPGRQDRRTEPLIGDLHVLADVLAPWCGPGATARPSTSTATAWARRWPSRSAYG